MYCVIRFVAEQPELESQLVPIGESLNRCQPGLYDGLARTLPKQFGCSLAKGDDWESQRAGMLAIIEKCGSVIHDAQTSGLDVYFDVAISPPDCKDRYIYNFLLDKDILKLLGERQIGFIVTLYGMNRLADEDPAAEE